MPTGYTAIVGEKNDVTFREFALRCSRAFGALVEMRDESLDAKIPGEFTPHNYHREALENARSQLRQAESMSLDEATREAASAYEEAHRTHVDYVRKKEELKGKYTSMLEQAREWQPPTSDHNGVKNFMVSQLKESIKFDCSTDYLEAPKKQSGVQYKRNQIAQAKKDVAYHTQEWEEEVKRARDRTKWVQDFLESLPKK